MPKTDQIASADVGMQMLAELKAMRAESKAANAEIRSMLSGKPMPIGPPKAAIDPVAEAAIAVLKKPLANTNVSCATCHRPGGKNGGLTFFDDKENYVGMGKDDKEADEQALAMAKKVSAEEGLSESARALTRGRQGNGTQGAASAARPEEGRSAARVRASAAELSCQQVRSYNDQSKVQRLRLL